MKSVNTACLLFAELNRERKLGRVMVTQQHQTAMAHLLATCTTYFSTQNLCILKATQYSHAAAVTQLV
jgi:hypothetical protein